MARERPCQPCARLSGNALDALPMTYSDEIALSWFDKGREFMDGGDWLAATQAFRQAVSIDPEFGEAYAGLGAALEAISLYGHWPWRRTLALPRFSLTTWTLCTTSVWRTENCLEPTTPSSVSAAYSQRDPATWRFYCD